MHRFLLSLVTLAGIAVPVLNGQRPPLADDRAAGAATVTVEHCKEWLGTLASPEFEGRGTGQDGFRKAAEFIRDRFEELGLVPKGDDGTFLQAVPWTVAKADPTATWIEFHKANGEMIRIPAERLEGQVSQSMAAEGPAVLLVLAPTAGQGSEPIPALEGIDVKDRIVVLHVQPGEGNRSAQMASFRAVAQIRDKEPAAILLLDRKAVGGGLTARSGAGRGGGNRAVRGARLSLASVRFGGDDAKAVLAAGGTNEAMLDKVGLTELGVRATGRNVHHRTPNLIARGRPETRDATLGGCRFV